MEGNRNSLVSHNNKPSAEPVLIEVSDGEEEILEVGSNSSPAENHAAVTAPRDGNFVFNAEFLRPWFNIPPTPSDLKYVLDLALRHWTDLTNALQHDSLALKENLPDIFMYAANTLEHAYKMIQIINGMQGERRTWSSEMVMIKTVVTCLVPLINGVTKRFEAADMDDVPELALYRTEWRKIFQILLKNVFTFDLAFSCVTLDVFGAMGKHLFIDLDNDVQTSYKAFLVCNGSNKKISLNVRGKIGRCVGKLLEIPEISSDKSFFLDVFDVISYNLQHGENTVKTSFAWTYAIWTDCLVESYKNSELQNGPRFTAKFLDTALLCTKVPMKGRYSACRASGNLFKWLPEEVLMMEDFSETVLTIVKAVSDMVGVGTDYKLRWNAAHALGHALESQAIYDSALQPSSQPPTLSTLSKWAAKSQNYKERTQCIVSLQKAIGYGTQFSDVWKALCLSISRPPVEESANANKFKVECVLLLVHLVKTMNSNDLPTIENTVTEQGDSLLEIAKEVKPDIPPERLDETAEAKTNLSKIRGALNLNEDAPGAIMILSKVISILEVEEEDTSV